MSNVTGLDEYQREAMRTAHDGQEPMDLAVAGLGLAGESGEVADIIKKYLGHGHGIDRAHLIKELGDSFWYIARIAYFFGISLSEIAQVNVDKLAKRYPNGWDPERSRNRGPEDV